MRIRHGLLGFVLPALCAAVLLAKDPAAVPSTQSSASSIPPKPPTTQQAKVKDQNAKAAVPKDWVKAENTKYGFAFFVPRKWEKNTATDTEAAYKLPAAKGQHQPLFMVVEKEGQVSTLQTEIDTAKKELSDSQPNLKITKEQASTLGGQPAWVIYGEDIVVETVPGKSPSQKPRTVKLKIELMKLVCVQGKTLCTVSFVAEGSAYSDNVKTVQTVMDNFNWTPAATP